MYLVVILAQKHFVNMCSILPTNLGKQYTFYCHCCQLMISMGNGWWVMGNGQCGHWTTGDRWGNLCETLSFLEFLSGQNTIYHSSISGHYKQVIQQILPDNKTTVKLSLLFSIGGFLSSGMCQIWFIRSANRFLCPKRNSTDAFSDICSMIPTNHEQSIFRMSPPKTHRAFDIEEFPYSMSTFPSLPYFQIAEKKTGYSYSRSRNRFFSWYETGSNAHSISKRNIEKVIPDFYELLTAHWLRMKKYIKVFKQLFSFISTCKSHICSAELSEITDLF